MGVAISTKQKTWETRWIEWSQLPSTQLSLVQSSKCGIYVLKQEVHLGSGLNSVLFLHLYYLYSSLASCSSSTEGPWGILISSPEILEGVVYK